MPTRAVHLRHGSPSLVICWTLARSGQIYELTNSGCQHHSFSSLGPCFWSNFSIQKVLSSQGLPSWIEYHPHPWDTRYQFSIYPQTGNLSFLWKAFARISQAKFLAAERRYLFLGERPFKNLAILILNAEKFNIFMQNPYPIVVSGPISPSGRITFAL